MWKELRYSLDCAIWLTQSQADMPKTNTTQIQQASSTTSPLEQKAYNLLNYCVKENSWNPDYETPAIVGFINEAANDKEMKPVWFIEPAIEYFYFLLEQYKEELSSVKPPAPKASASAFVDRFRNMMKANITAHWLVMPIHRAKLNDVLEFGDYLFIPEHFPRKKKLAILAEKSLVTQKEMEERAEHTEETRSRNFYEYTLMCRMVSHHSSWVHHYGTRIALLDFAILRVLKHAHELETHETLDYASVPESLREPNRHIVVNTKDSYSWGHLPMWADAQTITMYGDLDWLRDKRIQCRFTELERAVGFTKPIDRLAFRFLRAAIFFSKAIDIQLTTRKKEFEGFGLELLHLMIAAESLLLDREAEKRLRLATLLSRLVNITGCSTEDIFTSIDSCYNWRSDYVHSGDDVFPEYENNFEEGQIQKKVYLVRHVIARLISEAPKYLKATEELVQRSTQSQLSVKACEKAWFKHLDEIWFAVLSGSGQPTL